jgi:hypothetical protein
MPRLTEEESEVIRRVILREANRFIKHHYSNTENDKFTISGIDDEFKIKVRRNRFKETQTLCYFEDFVFEVSSVIHGVAIYSRVDLTWKNGIVGGELVPQYRKKFKINKIMPRMSKMRKGELIGFLESELGQYDVIDSFDFKWNYF